MTYLETKTRNFISTKNLPSCPFPDSRLLLSTTLRKKKLENFLTSKQPFSFFKRKTQFLATWVSRLQSCFLHGWSISLFINNSELNIQLFRRLTFNFEALFESRLKNFNLCSFLRSSFISATFKHYTINVLFSLHFLDVQSSLHDQSNTLWKDISLKKLFCCKIV